MPLRNLAPRLDPSAPEPMALQLARTLAEEIRGGWLKPGDPIPGTRVIAEELGLTRYVVMAALRELALEGWVDSRPSDGTFVADELPRQVTHRWGRSCDIMAPRLETSFPIPSEILPVSSLVQGAFDLREGCPDPRLAPREELGRAYRRAMQRHGEALLGRGESRGNEALREQLARHLRHTRMLNVGAENLLVTRGSAMALTLLAKTLLPKALPAGGAHVVMENPAHPLFREILGSMPGIHLHPVSVDASGLDVDALEDLLRQQPISLVRVTPQHQLPTMVTLAPGRCQRLLELARSHGFAILEEDAEFDFWNLRAPLASLDDGGSVIHMGSLSQMLAPGLDLGFLVAPVPLIDRLARVRQQLGMQGDRVMEWALADCIRDGVMDRHLTQSRRIYQERRDHFEALLLRELGAGFRVFMGSLSCWVATPPALNVERWAARSKNAGVLFHPGSVFEASGQAVAFAHLGFAHLEREEAADAVHRLKQALPATFRSARD